MAARLMPRALVTARPSGPRTARSRSRNAPPPGTTSDDTRPASADTPINPEDDAQHRQPAEPGVRRQRTGLLRGGGIRRPRHDRHDGEQRQECRGADQRRGGAGDEVDAAPRPRDRHPSRRQRPEPVDGIVRRHDAPGGEFAQERLRVQRQCLGPRRSLDRLRALPESGCGDVVEESCDGWRWRRAAVRAGVPVEQRRACVGDPDAPLGERHAGSVFASRGDLVCEIEQPAADHRPGSRLPARSAQRLARGYLVDVPRGAVIPTAREPVEPRRPVDLSPRQRNGWCASCPMTNPDPPGERFVIADDHTWRRRFVEDDVVSQPWSRRVHARCRQRVRMNGVRLEHQH